LRGQWREDLLEALGSSEKLNTAEYKHLSVTEINQRINYGRRYVLALLSPTIVLLTGIFFYYFAIRIPEEAEPSGVLLGIDFAGLADGFYFAVITMTTIGYGDVTPSSPIAKAFGVAYLPIAVVALADAVADLGLIGMRRNIRETDYGKASDESLLRDAVRHVQDGGAPNFHPELTESEFIVDQLLAHSLVDEDAVLAIREQFQHLTRNAKVAKRDEPKLTNRLVFEEIRERAFRGVEGSLSPGAQALDLHLDRKSSTVTFKWSSYEEWLSNSWQMRVLAKANADQEGVVPDGHSQLKTLTLSSFRML